MSREEYSIHILKKVVIDGFLLCGLTLCIYASVLLWSPFERGFFCGDEFLMFPYRDDTVTVPMLRIVGLGLPFLAILVCEWALLRKESSSHRFLGVAFPRWIQGAYCAAVSFSLGLCFTELSSNIAKNTIGRPRPHFFDLCRPSVNCSASEWHGRYIQSYEYECTGNNTEKFRDMRMSFLSGHSSWAAYTMIFFALYLERRMTWSGTRALRHSMQFAAIMLSWYTALSRVSDYKHHWSDVLAGYGLGITVAVLVWTFCTDLIEIKKKHAPLSQHDLPLSSANQSIVISS